MRRRRAKSVGLGGENLKTERSGGESGKEDWENSDLVCLEKSERVERENGDDSDSTENSNKTPNWTPDWSVEKPNRSFGEGAIPPPTLSIGEPSVVDVIEQTDLNKNLKPSGMENLSSCVSTSSEVENMFRLPVTTSAFPTVSSTVSSSSSPMHSWKLRQNSDNRQRNASDVSPNKQLHKFVVEELVQEVESLKIKVACLAEENRTLATRMSKFKGGGDNQEREGDNQEREGDNQEREGDNQETLNMVDFSTKSVAYTSTSLERGCATTPTTMNNNLLMCLISLLLIGFIYKLFVLQFSTDKKIKFIFVFLKNMFPETFVSPLDIIPGKSKLMRQAPIILLYKLFLVLPFLIFCAVTSLIKAILMSTLAYAIRLSALGILILVFVAVASGYNKKHKSHREKLSKSKSRSGDEASLQAFPQSQEPSGRDEMLFEKMDTSKAERRAKNNWPSRPNILHSSGHGALTSSWSWILDRVGVVGSLSVNTQAENVVEMEGHRVDSGKANPTTLIDGSVSSRKIAGGLPSLASGSQVVVKRRPYSASSTDNTTKGTLAKRGKSSRMQTSDEKEFVVRRNMNRSPIVRQG